jgi:DNA-binding transcriptional LysR family regulator
MRTESLTELRSLVAVIETGSIADAARTSGYSPAAVSRHISGLERELGVRLFQRTGRALRPSVLARIVAEKARLLLDEAEHFDREVRALARGDEGIVRLAYFRAVGTTVLPLIFATFADLRPNAKLIATEHALSEEVVDVVRSGATDLGITWGYPEPEAPELANTALMNDALLLLTAIDREDLHDDPTDLSKLVGEPFSTATVHKGSPPVVDEMFRSQGLPAPTITHRLSDHAMTKALIAAGVVIALIPALGVSDATPGVRRSIVVDDFRRIYLSRGRSSNPLTGVLEAAIADAVGTYRGYGVTSLI